jgi:hypothetical protein
MKRLFLHIFVFFLFIGNSSLLEAFEHGINIDFKHDFPKILIFNSNIEGKNTLPNKENTEFDAKTDYINTNFDIFTKLTAKFNESNIEIIENLELIAQKTVFFRKNYDRN